MRARNVSVAVVGGGSSLRVWNAAFEFESHKEGANLLPKTANGKVDEAQRKKIQDKIAKAIAGIDFSSLEEP